MFSILVKFTCPLRGHGVGVVIRGPEKVPKKQNIWAENLVPLPTYCTRIFLSFFKTFSCGVGFEAEAPLNSDRAPPKNHGSGSATLLLS